MKYLVRLKENLHYSRTEIRDLFIGILLTAFILSFNDWGAEEFNVLIGLGNLLIAFAIVVISVFMHDMVQRLFASWLGVRVKFELWWIGILAALAFAFLTNGNIKLFFLGGVALSLIKGKRLGKFYYRISLRTMSIIAITGPLTNIGLAVIAKILSIFFPGLYILNRFLLFNLVYAVLALLPIPPLDGSKMLYHSRLIYIFAFGTVLGYLIFSQLHWAWSFMWAFLFGIFFLVVFYYTIEKPG